MHCTLSYYVSSTVVCIPVPHGRVHLCIYFLLLPATGIPLSPFWQVQVPYTKVSASSRRSEGRANTFVCIPIPSLNPPFISKCFSDFTLFRSARISIVSSIYILYLPNFPTAIISHLFPPILFQTFSTTPSHLVHPFVKFSQLYHVWLATYSLAFSLLFYCLFNFLTSLFVLGGYILSSVL